MSIRLRLSVWYSAIFGLTLILLSVALYLFMVWHLQNMANESIESRAQHLASAIAAANDVSTENELRLVPLESFEAPEVFVQVWSDDGRIIAASTNLIGRQLDRPPVFWEPRQINIDGLKVKEVIVPVIFSGEEIAYVQVGTSLRANGLVLSGLRWVLVLGGLAAVVTAGVISLSAAGRVLRPVADMTETARAIALSRGFSRRLDTSGENDELGKLAITFNEMLASLEHAYDSQRRFTADASHEIRAPLTAIRGNLELLERIPTMSPEDRERSINQALEEVERLSRLVNDLLGLARADAGQAIRSEPVELDVLVLEIQKEASHLSNDISVDVTQVVPATVLGDADRLKELLLALAENAVRYTPSDGSISIELSTDERWATVIVRDTGIGIDPEDLPYVFDRFWRADRARSRDSGGTGLGLAIAKWIVEHHDGEIELKSSPNNGTTVSVRLPIVRSA